MSLVIDFESKRPREHFIAQKEITGLQDEVIAVQYHALGPSSLEFGKQLNRLLLNTAQLLSTLGFSQDDFFNALMQYKVDAPKDIDDSMKMVCLSAISLASTLEVKVYEGVRDKLNEMIANPNSFQMV